MKTTLTVFTRFTLVALSGIGLAFKSSAVEVPKWVDLFNGKDLTGWIDVNTSPDTWYVKDGILVCKGKPIGVMRREAIRELPAARRVASYGTGWQFRNIRLERREAFRQPIAQGFGDPNARTGLGQASRQEG